METQRFTNRLMSETSPYLLQHAHNPVDWFAWGEEALQKAKSEDKPILVSIGYSACHWCHVMERESFEDEETALLMNKYFVNIKVDREERPDIDHIYMDAVQTIAGSGGWPLNVFLTPDAKPFYGGTYFPPVRSFNRISWKELLESVHHAYTTKKGEIIEQAENLTQHLINSNNIGKAGNTNTLFTEKTLQQIADNILANADEEWGGFGKAPKFPQTFCVIFLLRHYYFTGHEQSLLQASLSLDKMAQGGIYDHLGGGFARYSTDAQWLAPHFEKMLYDNALFLNVYAEAYQLTKNRVYAQVLQYTANFIKREMQHIDGAFYSAFDADSEGVEGKYYTWSKKEIDTILGEESEIFCRVHNISEKGNWEHTNILWFPESLEKLPGMLHITLEDLQIILKNCQVKLLSVRDKRVRPALDDKILLGWNALMITALCKCFAALDDDIFLRMAEQNIMFLEKELQGTENEWFHSYKKYGKQQTAFLDDYAALVSAYIHLQEVTGNQEYLLKAKNITDKVLNDFSDGEDILFYFSPANQKDIIVRKKEIYDGATASGNSMMAYNLLYLSIVFDKPEWRIRTETMIQSLADVVIRYPASFGYWAITVQTLTNELFQIAIVGDQYAVKLKEFMREYIPVKVIQSSKAANSGFPLLTEKKTSVEDTFFYVCSNYQCHNPVEKVADATKILGHMKF